MVEQTPSSRGKRLNASAVYTLLRNDIVRMKYLRQDQLPPERELAGEYGVARGTIRNVLNALENEGLIFRRHGSGTYVRYTANSQLESIIEVVTPLQLIEARMAFEPHVARIAAISASRQDRKLLREKVEQLEHNQDGIAAFTTLDEQFHRLIVECSHNPLIVGLYHFLDSVRSHQQWNRVKHRSLNPDIIARFNVQHRAIAEAIVNMEIERVGELVKEHLQTTRVILQ